MMSLFMLLGALRVGRLLAAYPLQCSFTLKGLAPNAPLENRLARGSVFGVVSMLVIAGYWILDGGVFSILNLAIAGIVTMLARVLFDYVKTDSKLLGKFKVASEVEMAQVAQDYKSPSPAIVSAAQAKSESNKMFWWGNGVVHCALSLIELAVVYLVK